MQERITVMGSIVAALLTSACCIGPIVLGGLGIGAVAAAQQLAAYRPLFLGVTALFLGLGFYLAYRPQPGAACQGASCQTSRIGRWGRPLLWMATILVAALVTFPYYYGPIRAALDKPPQRASVTAQPTQLSTVKLKVGGMTCSGCAVSVRNALLETPGVVSASVDHEAGRATVQFDPTRASTTQIVEAINKTGYKASF